MFCPKCGKINPDDAQMCSGCNSVLHEETQTAVPQKKGKGIKILFAIIAVLISVCIVVFLLSGCGPASLPEDRMTF